MLYLGMVRMRIKLEHGSGGKVMQDLIRDVVSLIDLKCAGGKGLDSLDDSGMVVVDNKKFALTTDSYTVKPIFFPGGDIGKLAVYGTINDLAVSGAKPIALTLSYVVEEGFELEKLKKITKSVNKALKEVRVPIVSGDIKVMEKGKLDKIIVNTAGIGVIEKELPQKARIGDKIIVSGSVGEHGLALLAQRFEFQSKLCSDCGAVLKIVETALNVGGVNMMKDPTRGGLAACLNEMAQKSNLGFFIEEESIPVDEEAQNIAEVLGIDPLQTACEGRVVMCVKDKFAEKILRSIKKIDPNAAIIGVVKEESKGKVILNTIVGGRRFLEAPIGELYPRIC